MSAPRTAQAQLLRLLHVLPAARRPGGASLRALARELGTDEHTILRDLDEVTQRAYYHPGGWPDDLQILVDADRVSVPHARGFERPLRLTAAETLCLAIALRGDRAGSRLPEPHRRTDLLDRAERFLGSTLPQNGAHPILPGMEPDPAGIRDVLLEAARGRHACAIEYAKASAAELDARVIHPYALTHAGGSWYVVGHCTIRAQPRVFRLDRIVAAAPTSDSFEVPPDFDPHDWVEEGRVFRPGQEIEVPVRYSARVARWVREWAGSHGHSWEEDGEALVLRHRVADPHWAVRHALLYGAEAEILGPPDVRALVLDTLERLAD
ncbi:MAG: WYL domain-containing protein [Gemmatimonadota bacterium]|nr:WYL domain-containing protein [Gemmatimonadota bacterium]